MSGRRLLAAVVIAALIAVSGIAAEAAWQTERSRVAEQHRAAAREAATSARLAFDQMMSKTIGGSGLVKDSGGIRRRGFRQFASRAIRQEGFAAIAWHPLIPSRRRLTFERAVAPMRVPSKAGGLKRAPGQAFHLPVRLIEGDLSRRGSIGIDALAVPALAKAARNSRDNAVPTASPPGPLLGSPQRGIVVFRPVFMPGLSIGTIGGRKRALIGVISMSIRGDQLSREIATGLAPGMTLEIEDSGKPLVNLDGTEANDASVPVEVAGRPWIVSVGGLKGPSELPAAAIAVAGFSLTMLVAVLFAAATRRERMLELSRAEAQRSAAREASLVRVGDALERTISIEGRLDELARTVVPGFADLCTIDLALSERGLQRVGVAGANPGQEEVLGQLEPGAGIEQEAIESGEVELALEVDDEMLHAMSADEADYHRRRSLGIESMIVAPMWARSRVLGVLTLYTTTDSTRHPFGGEDAALAAEIAERAALAIDNARLYEEQLDIAQTLQRALLPKRLPQPDRIEVAARHRAGREGTEVGGDFYDFFDGSGRWVAAVGDVCGKGAEAAALTGLVRHTLRASAEHEGPAKAVTHVDQAIYRETHGSTFCTLACASIEASSNGDRGSVHATAAVAGHPEPLIIRSGGTIERVPRTGPLMGARANSTFEQSEIELQPGDTLLLYTDGITEARSNGELFGEARLTELTRRLSSLPIDAMLARLEDEVVGFAGGHPQDDIALLAVRILPDK